MSRRKGHIQNVLHGRLTDPTREPQLGTGNRPSGPSRPREPALRAASTALLETLLKRCASSQNGFSESVPKAVPESLPKAVPKSVKSL
jgi:hypothetical protein